MSLFCYICFVVYYRLEKYYQDTKAKLDAWLDEITRCEGDDPRSSFASVEEAQNVAVELENINVTC